MKVLMTGDTVGGVWQYALELTRALADHGVEIHLATMGKQPDEAQRKSSAALKNLRLHPSGYKLEWMDGGQAWGDVDRAGEWLLALEREIQPEVIHLNGYVHGALPFGAPVLVVGHSCVLSWWRAVEGAEAPAEWAEYRRRVGAGLQAADYRVAPSRAMSRALETHYGQPRAAVQKRALAKAWGGGAEVIYNGRSARTFRPGPKRPVILSAGRLWDKAKNIDALARVAERLEWPVEIAGDAGEAAGALCGRGHVNYLGRLGEEQMAERLSRAAIYVLPARYEPFGLSLLEAALSGCALVAGDIASLREIWGDAAMYVAPGDDRQLVETIEKLTGDPALLRSMAARARAQAGAYTPERMARAYVRVYRWLVTSGGRPPLPIRTSFNHALQPVGS